MGWGRKTDQLTEHVGEELGPHARVDVDRIPLPASGVGRPDAGHLVGMDVVVALGHRQFGVELRSVFLGDLHRLLARHLAELQKLLEVALVDARPLLNDAVERRLGERRFVGLVVAAAPEAVHVDDDIPLELAAEVHRQIDDLCDRLRILTVDMKDRDLKHLRHVGGVGAGAGLAGAGREPDLVVDDDMERAADAVGVELAQIERLLDDSLAGEGGVAVDQQHHPRLPGEIADPVLAGPDASDGDGIDELEVAGIEAEREVDVAAVGGTVIARMAEVVLHIAAADMELRVEIGELTEDPLGALPHDISEDVEPAAVGHGEDDIANPLRGRAFDRHLEERDERFAPLEGEALRPEEPLLDELLEHRSTCHLPVDAQLLAPIELHPVFAPLHPHLEPLPHAKIVHVHELHADRPAVGVPQALDDLAQRHRLRSLDRVGGERPVHVLLGEVVEPGIELRQARAGPTERIDLRHEVAADAVRSDELVDAVLEKRHPLLGGIPGCHRQRQWHRLTNRGIGETDIPPGDGDGVGRGDAVGCHQEVPRVAVILGAMVLAPVERRAGMAVQCRGVAIGRTPARRRSPARSLRPVGGFEVRPPLRIDTRRINGVLVEQFLEKSEAGGSGGVEAIGKAHGCDPVLTVGRRGGGIPPPTPGWGRCQRARRSRPGLSR